MFPMFYRHDAYWGAPRPGFCYDSPRMDFGPRPMHHANPFGSFMGGFFGGLGMAAACGWGNSYVSYPTASVSIFPRSYSPYQSYSAAPSFGYDYSALAFNDAYARFVNACSTPRYTTAPTQTPTSNWSMSASGWTMPSFGQTWSQPFSSLTQSGRSEQTYSIIPTKPRGQTSAQSGSSQQQSSGEYTVIPVKNANTATPDDNTYTTIPVNNTATANQGGSVSAQQSQQGNNASSVGGEDKPLSQENLDKINKLKEQIKKLEAEKQSLGDIPKMVQENVTNVYDPKFDKYHNLDFQIVHLRREIREIYASSVEPSIETKLNDLKTSADNKPAENAKDAATIKAEEDEFNAKCKGGDCGDYSDRLYYDEEKGEWVKSTKKGYPRQPIAPESTLVQIPEQYTTDKSGIKYYANPEALKHFVEMSDVAFTQRGIQMTIKSAYRRYKDQEQEFEADQERIRKLKAEGYKSEPKAAPPGYSEHHKGDAFDLAESSPINVRNDGDFQTDENGKFVLKDGKRIPVAAHIKWLEKNAKFFGFEMSYPPKNKLGVKVEGWHWRFNPELCEKYKQQREELVQKYVAGEVETVQG